MKKLIVVLLLTGCTELCDAGISDFCKPEPVPPVVETPVPVPTSTPRPAPIPTPSPVNTPIQGDIKDTWLDGNEGNLWKPESDNTGKTVILLHKKYKDEMDSCTIDLNNGKKESLICLKGEWNNFSCFANGDRQHWRSNNSCKNIKSTKAVCRKGNTTLTITGGSDTCKRQD